MARGVFRITCLLLALSVEYGLQATASTTETDQSWKEAMLDLMHKVKNTLPQDQSSCGGGLGPVVAHLVAEQTKMQNQIAASSSAMSSMKAELQAVKDMSLKADQARVEEQTKMQNQIAASTSAMSSMKAELQSVKDMDQGSTFVRWGRKTCPANTTLVYSGLAGGKRYNEKGSGTNSLCLTRSPQFDNTPAPISYYALLNGGEYEGIYDHGGYKVPCSVCRAPQSTTIMVASTLTCPLGWTVQYTGHLTSNYNDYYATEYVCMDGEPENDTGERKDDDGHIFYYVVTECGSLPCPPYQNGKVVTCVVCSK